jgi:hypothetical protein
MDYLNLTLQLRVVYTSEMIFTTLAIFKAFEEMLLARRERVCFFIKLLDNENIFAWCQNI